jgi:hypothetical protein
MASDVIQATLAPPQAGLPRFQAVLLRRLLFPIYSRCTSWDRALADFRTEGHKSLRLAQQLPLEAFRTRVLIRPLWGLEDHARDWSVEMILEHLIEAGTCIATTIVELSHGEKPRPDSAPVIPSGGRGLGVLQDFRAFLDDYAGTLTEDVGDRSSKRTHAHPWLGELTARDWLCRGAQHQAVHRRQLEAIVTSHCFQP